MRPVSVQQHGRRSAPRPTSLHTHGHHASATRQTRRLLQGNCSDPDAAAALGLSPAEARELLPLKPFQCLVIVDQPFLKHIGGDVLVDNLYLQLRRDAVWPGSAFISTLPYTNSLDIGRSGLYVTAVTFHAAARGSTRGISLFLRDAAALVSGALPPVSAACDRDSSQHGVCFCHLECAPALPCQLMARAYSEGPAALHPDPHAHA